MAEFSTRSDEVDGGVILCLNSAQLDIHWEYRLTRTLLEQCRSYTAETMRGIEDACRVVGLRALDALERGGFTPEEAMVAFRAVERRLHHVIQGALHGMQMYNNIVTMPQQYAAIKQTSTPQANQQAEALLLRHLTPEQQQSWQRKRAFEVKTVRGMFVIHEGRSNNILELATGKTYCAAPEGALPLADSILAQKLALEADVDGFLNNARSLNQLTLGNLEITRISRQIDCSRLPFFTQNCRITLSDLASNTNLK